MNSKLKLTKESTTQQQEDTAFAPATSLSKQKTLGPLVGKKRFTHQITGGWNCAAESDLKGGSKKKRMMINPHISRGKMAPSKVKNAGSLAGSKVKFAPLTVLSQTNHPSSSVPQSPQLLKASSSLDETREQLLEHHQTGTSAEEKLAEASITAVKSTEGKRLSTMESAASAQPSKLELNKTMVQLPRQSRFFDIRLVTTTKMSERWSQRSASCSEVTTPLPFKADLSPLRDAFEYNSDQAEIADLVKSFDTDNLPNIINEDEAELFRIDAEGSKIADPVDNSIVDLLNDGFLNEPSLVVHNPIRLLYEVQAGIESLEVRNFSIEEMLKKSDAMVSGRRSHAVQKPFLRRSKSQAGK